MAIMSDLLPFLLFQLPIDGVYACQKTDHQFCHSLHVTGSVSNEMDERIRLGKAQYATKDSE